jgi:NTP pyrophosphatase (non-canonical NTP hydrolase)
MNPETKEILLILQEECAEVIQAISKCMRFGPDQIKPGKEDTNIAHLEQEIADVQAMIELLVDNNVGVSLSNIELKKQIKFAKLKLWSNLTITK